MIMLTEQQSDALSEVINIAFARSAASLSELTGQRVVLDVPHVHLHALRELSQVLVAFVQNDIASVHQIFSGPVSGDAFLLLDYEGAVLLADLLMNERVRSGRLNASAREVLTEIGNILLNACLSVFGDLLQVQVSFSVPRLHLEDLSDLLSSVVVGKNELEYALVVHTTFRLRKSAVSGYLLIVLGIASLDQLLEAVEQLG